MSEPPALLLWVCGTERTEKSSSRSGYPAPSAVEANGYSSHSSSGFGRLGSVKPTYCASSVDFLPQAASLWATLLVYSAPSLGIRCRAREDASPGMYLPGMCLSLGTADPSGTNNG